MLMNILAIIIILIMVLVALMIFLKKEETEDLVDESVDIYSLDYLISRIEDTFNMIAKTRVEDLNLNKLETRKAELNKKKLKDALASCAFGDIGSKDYLKEYIREILQSCGINSETINEVIQFDNPAQLTITEKFDICLYYYKKQYGLEALGQMIKDFDLVKPKFNKYNEIYYEITSAEIAAVFRDLDPLSHLDYNDKLIILSQRIYQKYKGLGVMDEIRDMNIDGMSTGVSGIPDTMYSYETDLTYNPDDPSQPLASYNSVWIMIGGKNVHLSFLGHGSQKELVRVCKVIYRYQNPCQLSERKGEVINNDMTGSRINVARPPLTESWGFWYRKFGSSAKLDITDIIAGPGHKRVNSGIVQEIIHWAFRGCLSTILTGTQGSGKTVMLSSLIQFLPPAKTLRLFEKTFEMAIRKQYKDRNIMTWQETDSVSLQQSIDYSKKSDGNIAIFGEIAEDIHASMAIQTGRVASDMLIGTHHAQTPVALVQAFAASINRVERGGDINLMTVDVASVLNLNIHLTKEINGDRHIAHITEIIPKEPIPYSDNLDEATIDYYNRITDRELFECREIVRWDPEINGFKIVNNFSPRLIRKIESNLNTETYALWQDFQKEIKTYVGGVQDVR